MGAQLNSIGSNTTSNNGNKRQTQFATKNGLFTFLLLPKRLRRRPPRHRCCVRPTAAEAETAQATVAKPAAVTAAIDGWLWMNGSTRQAFDLFAFSLIPLSDVCRTCVRKIFRLSQVRMRYKKNKQSTSIWIPRSDVTHSPRRTTIWNWTRYALVLSRGLCIKAQLNFNLRSFLFKCCSR